MNNQEHQHNWNEDTGYCRECGEHSLEHDGIYQHYLRKDREVKAEYEAWKNDPNPHKGSFNPKTYID